MKLSEPIQLIVDIHELDSGIYEDLFAMNIAECTEKHLESGDIVLMHQGKCVALELKRESDFDNSLQSGRLHNQICNMLDNYDMAMVIIENWHPFVTDEDTENTIADRVRRHEMAVRTLNRRVTTYETKDHRQTLDLIEEIVRDMKAGKLFYMKRPIIIEPELSDAMRVICSLPNIKQVLGERILEEFGSPLNAMNNLRYWTEIDGIGDVKMARIKAVLEEKI